MNIVYGKNHEYIKTHLDFYNIFWAMWKICMYVKNKKLNPLTLQAQKCSFCQVSTKRDVQNFANWIKVDGNWSVGNLPKIKSKIFIMSKSWNTILFAQNGGKFCKIKSYIIKLPSQASHCIIVKCKLYCQETIKLI